MTQNMKKMVHMSSILWDLEFHSLISNKNGFVTYLIIVWNKRSYGIGSKKHSKELWLVFFRKILNGLQFERFLIAKRFKKSKIGKKMKLFLSEILCFSNSGATNVHLAATWWSKMGQSLLESYVDQIWWNTVLYLTENAAFCYSSHPFIS